MNVIEQFSGQNDIDIAQDVLDTIPGTVIVNGTGNRIRIGKPARCTDIFVEVCGDCEVVIGANCVLTGQHVRIFAPGGKVSIGEGCSFNGTSFIHQHEAALISLGANCLIADNTSFSSSHVHKILDVKTGERLNPPGDIIVGNHVWISADATLWPGAKIGSDSVVGKGTYVSRAFPANCIVAGTPARVIREGVTWEG